MDDFLNTLAPKEWEPKKKTPQFSKIIAGETFPAGKGIVFFYIMPWSKRMTGQAPWSDTPDGLKKIRELSNAQMANEKWA